MPVYANAAAQRRHPKALLLIVGAHAVLIAAAMTAKMDLVGPFEPTKTIIDLIPAPGPEPVPPEPKAAPPEQHAQPRDSHLDAPPPVLSIPQDPGPIVDTTPIPLPPDPGPIIGASPDPMPIPTPTVARAGPRFATPEWAIRPPYPDDKRRLEEEAVLRLRLSIDQHGRVVAVEPVGRADRSFVEAARRHVIAHWRYKPATEDGRPVASSTIVTLRFELES
jgi:periplasmic protein TonB